MKLNELREVMQLHDRYDTIARMLNSIDNGYVTTLKAGGTGAVSELDTRDNLFREKIILLLKDLLSSVSLSLNGYGIETP